ncbi:uroporphyrinogen decarboxylase family protein [Desulfospira joergensenii]|uniref:uroporphyrinogen decarboxylase family protein n=1 Tax=Desulfospira joergensenii TaxID=53329 RepID=UPI000426AFF8|nr:uroporphyrinogen decarboxylase family protein [Desulfospira joergensenii]
MSEEILKNLADAVVAMDIDETKAAARMALEAGVPPLAAIHHGLARGMKKVGALYAAGEYFVPELICCAETMNAGLEVLSPEVLETKDPLKGRIVMGVVEGDTHDIGKNIVGMMLKAEGYEVIDLGRNVPLSAFVDKAMEVGARVIAVSSLMTTTMAGMAKIVEDCHGRCKEDRPMIIVGGAPVTQDFARSIGADGYAEDALVAVETVGRLMGSGNRPSGKKGSLLEFIGQKNHRAIMPWMSTIGLRLTGYPLYEVYRSPEKQLEVARAMDETFPADFIYPMDYGKIFCEALGIPMLRPSHDFPSVVENLITDNDKLSEYRPLNPEIDGLMPVYMESLGLLANRFEKPLMLSVEGPFTLAMELAGATNLARAIVREPEFVNHMLAFTVKTVSRYIRSAVAAGVQLIIISEPSAIMLSPRRFEDLVGPSLRQVYDSFDAWKALHICGNTTHLLKQLLDCGAECLSLDQLVDIPGIAPQIPRDIVICGNIDPLGVLKEKTPEEIREITLSHLQDMRQYPNFMLSFGCDCLPDTPLENLKAVMEAGHIPQS